jgi:cyclophilin family peptidyl-prolyl cis-trans isomerase
MTKSVLASLVILSVTQIAGCPLVTDPFVPGVRVITSLGEFVIELDPEDAPVTVENFLQYVNEDFYDGTIFHRVVADFVLQGGGMGPDLVEKETRDPIANESNNGLSNLRATVAMARTDDPNSATAQFYVNLVDNAELDATPFNPGYAVFGRVVEGMDVVDQIAAVATESRGGLTDVPVEDVVIEDVERIILPKEIELTSQGEAYIEDQKYQALVLLRELLVDLLGYGILGALG